MPRSLVLGNGTLLATFDEHLQMRDVYFPFVGKEDHTTYGRFHRVGFSVDGRGLSWTNDGSWRTVPGYLDKALVTSSTLSCDRLALSIVSEDFVDPVRNILVRSFRLRTTDGMPRTVKCFFHHDFYLYGDKQKDTAFYEPHTRSVIHYREQRYFLVGGAASDPVNCVFSEPTGEFHPFFRHEEHIDHCGLTSFAIGKSNYRGLEGTWRDAEDGVLSRSPIEQGSVDSTVEIDCTVYPDRDSTVYLWVCAGRKIADVHELQHLILKETPEHLKDAARNYWRGWLASHADPGRDLPQDVQDLYWRSLLLIRTQIDNHGGILAANDSDIMQFNRDTYTYVWPRDGAFVSMALTRASEREAVERFLKFCEEVQTDEGYFLHKYNPDGSAGSSWHPWYRDGMSVLPIQCDETALPVIALWEHYRKYQDFEFLHSLYPTLVMKAADFLVRYREQGSGLPLQCYDLWEEHRGVFSFTTAAVYAGLKAAADISLSLGHYRHAERYTEAADEVREALIFHLYDERERCFLKKIKRENGKTTERDATPDASVVILWMFGVVPPDDPRMLRTMERLRSSLTVRTPIGGVARYRHDFYQLGSPHSADVPGNPWIITTLWFAQWQIAVAKVEADLQPALDALEWACRRATPGTGVLPEQVHPHTGAPLSVAPLTWSHAVFVDTVLRYKEKLGEIRERDNTQYD